MKEGKTHYYKTQKAINRFDWFFFVGIHYFPSVCTGDGSTLNFPLSFYFPWLS